MSCASKYSCGQVLSSNCIRWQGYQLTSVKPEVFDCDVRVTDVVAELDKQVKKLQDAVDLTHFPTGCLDVDSSDTVGTVLRRVQSEICSTTSTGSSTASQTYDLSCLNDSCVGSTATLKEAIELLAKEICALKARTAVSTISNPSLFLP